MPWIDQSTASRPCDRLPGLQVCNSPGTVAALSQPIASAWTEDRLLVMIDRPLDR